MGRNRMLLAISLLLAMVGGSAVASGVGSEQPTTVSLSGGTGRAPTTDSDLAPSEEEPIATTSTTSAPVATSTTTTARPAVTTTAPPATTSTTVAAPVPTTTSTTAAPNTATINVVNNFSATVKISVNDVNSKEWTLAPGAKAGPWTLQTATDHGDGATVQDPATQCGYGDGEDFFKAGHTYLIEAKKAAQNCGDSPAPMLVIHDKTTGTSVTLGGP